MTWVFLASGAAAERETKVMRLPLITTMEWGCTESEPGLMTVTSVMTLCVGSSVACARAPEANARTAQSSNGGRRAGEFMRGGLLSAGLLWVHILKRFA